MATVTVLVGAQATPVPAGQTYASITLTLTDGTGAVQTASIDGVTTLSAVFSNVGVGAGSVVAQAVDTTGAAMGASASAAFTIAAPATFPQPVSVTVTVS